MDSDVQLDQLYMSLNWDDDSSTESDSGISSISNDSISSHFESSHQDHSFINTVSTIAHDISQQSPVYSKALIDFTISGLKSEDVFIRRSAAVFLWQLFRACNMTCYDSMETKEKMTLLLKVTENVVESLEYALKTDSYSSQMLYWVSGCFHYISRTQIGCDQLMKGNIGLLISMLGCDLQAVVFYSITTIHNILLSSPCPFSGIHLIRCVSHILERIKVSDNVGETQLKLMAICIDCLTNLAYHNNLVKAQISTHCSVTNIVINTLLRNVNNEKLLLLGLRLFKILSTDQNAKNTLSNSYAFSQLLINMFKTKVKLNSQIWSITFWTLRNLSDILFHEQPLTIFGEVLVQICDKFQQINRLENDLILQCAAGILANASCDSAENKSLLVKMKVHDTILMTLSVPKEKFQRWSGESLEAMYRCLHHLCSNHDKALIVIDRCLMTDTRFLLNFNEILILSEDHKPLSLDVPISWSILRAWLGLIRHLSIHQTKLLPSKYQINQNSFSDIIYSNLSHFQVQLENFISISTQNFIKNLEPPTIQYLNQLHSSILHIISINTSPKPLTL